MTLSTSSFVFELPPELWRKVFCNINDFNTYTELIKVCKNFKEIIRDRSVTVQFVSNHSNNQKVPKNLVLDQRITDNIHTVALDEEIDITLSHYIYSVDSLFKPEFIESLVRVKESLRVLRLQSRFDIVVFEFHLSPHFDTVITGINLPFMRNLIPCALLRNQCFTHVQLLLPIESYALIPKPETSGSYLRKSTIRAYLQKFYAILPDLESRSPLLYDEESRELSYFCMNPTNQLNNNYLEDPSRNVKHTMDIVFTNVKSPYGFRNNTKVGVREARLFGLRERDLNRTITNERAFQSMLQEYIIAQQCSLCEAFKCSRDQIVETLASGSTNFKTDQDHRLSIVKQNIISLNDCLKTKIVKFKTKFNYPDEHYEEKDFIQTHLQKGTTPLVTLFNFFNQNPRWARTVKIHYCLSEHSYNNQRENYDDLFEKISAKIYDNMNPRYNNGLVKSNDLHRAGQVKKYPHLITLFQSFWKG
ncbi:hypothetical protein WICPIJ_003026 [Wickerhamomyces pijperi]|uniref:F-box domain-containing protein n=1 Tax=Wickerhamomyces pijperi TaxID=599730 RepID=A0A9P8TP45_WICPI|nr:hypothetical protein WICPIJ_003026 [Wickerhamomyces pijperi]